MRRQHRQRHPGFSLFEIGIAIAVLAVGVLGVLSVFTFSLQSSRHAAWTSEAVGLCRQTIEEIRSQNLPFQSPIHANLNDTRREAWDTLLPLNASPLTDLPPDPSFRRKTRVRRLSTDASNYLSQIAEIEVSIYWMDRGRLRKVTMTAQHRQP